MKINWGFGPPKDDAQPAATAERERVEHASAPPQHGWTAGANLATKAIVAGVWVAVACGPLALGLLFLNPPRAQVLSASAAEDVVDTGDAAAVAGFAERAVVAWLETPRDQADVLTDFFGDLDRRRPAVPWDADNPTVARIEQLDDQTWSVVVSVEVSADPATVPTASPGSTQRGDGGAPTPTPLTGQRLYFHLPVHAGEVMVAEALPAPVAAPTAGESPTTEYGEKLPGDHPALARIQSFFTHLLVTGNQNEVDTYTAPGSRFVAVTSSPYVAAQVIEVRSVEPVDDHQNGADTGEVLDVLATVRISDANAQEIDSQYALTLTTRAGRWEVSEILGAPLVKTGASAESQHSQAPRPSAEL